MTLFERCFTKSAILLLALFLVGTASLSIAGQTDATVKASGSVVVLPMEPGRDESDEDSVLYEYGFEDGWNGWEHVDLTNPGSVWHASETHALEGNSWWCADEELGGYDDHWLQYMITPEFSLADFDGEPCGLQFKVYWAVEPPEGAQDPYDGWDGSNVWISTDGGDNWDVLMPDAPEYTSQSLYSFGEEWGMGADIPGWTGTSGEWLDADFDLSQFGGQQSVMIRWAFCSDPSWHTGNPQDDPDGEAYGLLVDDIIITGGRSVILTNNADEQGDLEEFDFSVGDVSGDFWDLSQEDAHRGDFSANCPIEPNLQNALVSPEIELPEDWYIWFEFWVRPDTRLSNSNPGEDNTLDDYFQVQVTSDGVRWQDVIYDYGDVDRLPLEEWTHYVPDLWFRNDLPEWRGKLNLTQFGGETIQLRWKLITDDVMEGDQGTGLWIDDVQIIMSSRREFDAGVEWLDVPFPNSVDIETRCQLSVRNYGLGNLGQIRKYYQFEDERANPIVPWDGIDSDTSRVYGFMLARIPYAGFLDFKTFTTAAGDEFTENDTMGIEGLLVYPPNIYLMGYDPRTTQFRYTIDNGSGAAVWFTPEDDGLIDGDDNPIDFDIKALHVQWNGSDENIDAETTLHIIADDGGVPGDDLYSTRLTIAQENLLPAMHIIDLTDVEELMGLNGDFWVWFEIHSDDGSPQIIGDNLPVSRNWGAGHHFIYDGGSLEEQDQTNYMLRAVLMASAVEVDDIDLVSSHDELDFGEVELRDRVTKKVGFFNGGNEDVTITSITSENRLFVVSPNFQPPTTLRIGEAVDIQVVFRPTEEGDFAGDIIIETNDETPPVIHCLAHTPGVGVNEDAVIPVEYALGEAYPNPFNPTTTIPFALPIAQDISLTIHDVSGRLVTTVASGSFAAGHHSVQFDASDLTTGVYMYKLNAGDFSVTSKLVLVK